MEKLEMIAKEQNPRDDRISFVKLSHSGFELFHDAMFLTFIMSFLTCQHFFICAIVNLFIKII